MKEFQIQIKVAHHFEALSQALKTFTFFAVPNGGKRNLREASKLKAMGVRAGAHDLVFLGQKKETVLIELKLPKGSLSPSQVTFHALIERLGHAQYVVAEPTGELAIARITGLLRGHGFGL